MRFVEYLKTVPPAPRRSSRAGQWPPRTRERAMEEDFPMPPWAKSYLAAFDRFLAGEERARVEMRGIITKHAPTSRVTLPADDEGRGFLDVPGRLR